MSLIDKIFKRPSDPHAEQQLEEKSRRLDEEKLRLRALGVRIETIGRMEDDYDSRDRSTD